MFNHTPVKRLALAATLWSSALALSFGQLPRAELQGAGVRPSSQNESPDGRDPQSRSTQRWRRIALGENAGAVTTSTRDLEKYIRRYRDVNVYDPVLAVFRIEATPLDEHAVALSGEAGSRWYKSGVEQMLKVLGFRVVRNDVQVLPEDTLGKAAFALAVVPSATMRSHPSMRGEQVNAIPHGWPLRLLREAHAGDMENISGNASRDDTRAEDPYDGRWYMAQSSEGYIGFVREDQIRRSDTYSLPTAILRLPQEVRTSATVLSLPGGTALYKKPGIGGFHVPAKHGDVSMLSSEVIPANPSARPTSETILTLSRSLMQTPYAWGGVTEEGIDCSGYTQYVYGLLGVYLPRDARPQSVVGRISAFGEDVERDAAAGDLVYFADEAGRISHVGIALGDGKLIHSSGGVGVHVCDYHEVSRSRPNGMLERVLYSRRVLP